MKKLTIPALAMSATVIVASTVLSRPTGIYSPTIARSTPSCGQCHRAGPGSAPGFPTLDVSLVPTARSLKPNDFVSMTTSATGGQTRSNLGGFATEATAGTFMATGGTRLHAGGSAIGHSRPANRTWTYTYRAPPTPGLVNVYSVVNTVDGNGKENSGDMWAFHGYDSTSRTSTPVRMFVNAPGVTPFGSSCVGSFGNHPVLGAPRAPTLGSGGFGFELHGAAPNTAAVLLFGTTPGVQLDLGPVGAPGCNLHVLSLAMIPAVTSSGNAERAEGTAFFRLPIPGRPAFAGLNFQVQAAVVDVQTGRTLPITMTNGLSCTVQ